MNELLILLSIRNGKPNDRTSRQHAMYKRLNGSCVCMRLTGNAGLEASCCNILESGEVLLSAAAGFWGRRMGTFAERYGRYSTATIEIHHLDENTKYPFLISMTCAEC